MKRKMINKITAIFIVGGIMLGFILGTGLNSTIQQNRKKAFAFEMENTLGKVDKL